MMTDRQRDRQTDRETDRQMDRKKEFCGGVAHKSVLLFHR